MPITWLDHKILKIVKGVYTAPGDTNSVESPIVTLNLLSNSTGISLAPDGWSPNIPSLKSGGVWADSPIADGRTLLSGVNANVTETMRVNIIGNSYQELMQYMSALRNMMQDCRDFWQSNAQINPVFLHWYARIGAGAQYALIYNIDADFEYVDSPTPTIEATLTIERECYWRSLPPGANPKQWRYEFYNQVYDKTKAPLFSSVDSLFIATVQNKSEFTATTGVALSSDNCAVIPASSIPGDAPALMSLLLGTTLSRPNIIIGKKTGKITQANASNNTLAQNCIFNAADGTLGTNATLANDTGAVKAPGAANAQRVEVSFATATNALRWRSLSVSLTPVNAVNRYIGRWRIFMRCRQSAGTLGDITMYLRVGGGSGVLADTDGVKLNVVNPPITTGGTSNSTDWGLVDMGTISIPLQPNKAYVNDGSDFATTSVGLSKYNASTFDVGLFALRSAGTGLLYICDLIFIPIDEGAMELTLLDSAGLATGLVYDDTGYLTHGNTEQIVMNGPPLSAAAGGLVSMQGQGFQLSPNVENRLYMVMYDSSKQSRTTDTPGVTINIIPRWQGIRGA